MKQARDCAAGTVHSRCPGPARGTPARRCHRAGEAWPGALPAPSSQPWVNLLLTSPPCPCVPGTPRTLQTLPGPPGPSRDPPRPPARPGSSEPAPAATRLLRAPPPSSHWLLQRWSRPKGRGLLIPANPRAAPASTPARGSALFPPPLPTHSVSPVDRSAVPQDILGR